MTLPHHLLSVWNPSYATDAMDQQVRAGTETHLYLTDDRSLYVAWVGEITAEHLPREQPEELKRLHNTRYHDRPAPDGLCSASSTLYNCDRMQKPTVKCCILLQYRGSRAVSR